jgi:hypothetical protein
VASAVSGEERLNERGKIGILEAGNGLHEHLVSQGQDVVLPYPPVLNLCFGFKIMGQKHF